MISGESLTADTLLILPPRDSLSHNAANEKRRHSCPHHGLWGPLLFRAAQRQVETNKIFVISRFLTQKLTRLMPHQNNLMEPP